LANWTSAELVSVAYGLPVCIPSTSNDTTPVCIVNKVVQPSEPIGMVVKGGNEVVVRLVYSFSVAFLS
jgi:hypothetical protein